MEFKVSVIIPVYNAVKFLEKAVESAIQQGETFEVILAEDGSEDDSYELCKKLSAKFHQVKVVTHPGRVNLGASKTRNLGLKNASADFISFLDADDFYNPGRYSIAKNILMKNQHADGVYEAIGTYCYDKESEKKHFERMRSAKTNHSHLELTTIDNPVQPEYLFETLLFGEKGWIHLNGLTLRRSSLIKVGFFDEDLRWSEDDEFFFRLSYSLKLYPGRLTEPVAMRGVHDNNFTLSGTSHVISREYNILLWKKLYEVMLRSDFNKRVNKKLLMRRLDFYNAKIIIKKAGLLRKLMKLSFLIMLLFHSTALIKKVY